MEANTNLPGIGDRLANRYRIMFGRGAGPSGAVFKALDLENDLSVALKVINAAFFEGPFAAMNIARLSRASDIEDPNVVKVYDFVSSEGRHFVTSQLVEGLSLRAVLDLHDEGGEHFPVPKLKSFGERMLNGVRAFHRKGLVHGNIKPENFFVLPDRLALSDPWHLVDRMLRDGEHIPVSDYYRAPEQLTDPKLEIPQSDLYAIGLILGELIAISPVKPGLALSTQVPRLTKRFDELFVTATALDPNARFDSVESFATCMREAFSSVQKEGLWVRRMHETGSFRAIRLPAADAPEVEPLAEMPVESLVDAAREPAPSAGDLMDIPEQEPADTVEPGEYDAEQYAPPPVEMPEIPEPAMPEADDENVVTFESVTSRVETTPPPAAGMQKTRPSQKGKKGHRQPEPQPAPRPAPTPPPPPRTVTQPQRPVQPPRTSQSFRAAPPPAPPSGPERKKPWGLIILGMLIVALIAVIAVVMTRDRNEQLAAQNKPAAVEAVGLKAPAVAVQPAPAPAPAPATAPAPVPVQPTPPVQPAAAPAPAPAQPAVQEPAAPVAPKAQKLADMLMCGSPAQVMVVTDDRALNGSGKKPADVAFCIDRQEFMEGGKTAGGLNLARAKSLCRKAGKSVCSGKQWAEACSSGKAGLENMVGGYWEWALDGRLHGGDSAADGAGCNSSDKRFSPKPTDGTRCCSAPEYKL